MKVKTTFLATMLAAATLLAGCAQQPGPKQSVGAVGGAVLGGLAGSQIGGGSGRLVATGVGAALGLLVGQEIGRNLDEVDQLRAEAAAREAATVPIGETITWNNPDTGHYGSVTPVRDGYASSGAYCREFQETVTIGGKTEQAYGTACRQPDGSWRIVQ